MTQEQFDKYADIFQRSDLTESFSLVDSFVLERIEMRERSGKVYLFEDKLSDYEFGKQAVALKNAKAHALAIATLCRIVERDIKLSEKFKHQSHAPDWDKDSLVRGDLVFLLSNVLRKKLPFQEDELMLMLDWPLGANHLRINRWDYPFATMLSQLENYSKTHQGLSAALDEKLAQLYQKIKQEMYDTRALQKRFERFWTQGTDEFETHLLLEAGELWSEHAVEMVNESPDEQKRHWTALINSCALYSGSKPTQKWHKEVSESFDSIPKNAMKAAFKVWITLLKKPGEGSVGNYRGSHPLLITDKNADVLRALTWLLAEYDDAETAELLGELALIGFQKVPGIGSRSVKLGNAAIYGLGSISGMEGVQQLSLLKIKVKVKNAFNAIDKALKAAAESKGISEEDLEEIGAPDYGLQDVGLYHETLDDFTAELSLGVNNAVTIGWIKSDGKRQKSVPAAVKEEHPDPLKALKNTAAAIKKMLPAQKARIEAAYLQERRWRYPHWSRYYLNQTLVGTLARRLIWTITQDGVISNVIWNGTALQTLEGETPTFSDDATVMLWHPLSVTADVVRAWREKLDSLQIVQPFKQAYREVYLLTDAERITATYSNRFAAHILKQYPFDALAKIRGWDFRKHAVWDEGSDDIPKRLLPHWNLRAEYWVETWWDESDTLAQCNEESGMYYYITTDQVRFYEGDAADPMPLENVPPLVLSEIFRDVDLFVGVCSIGNDPEWGDNARDYWTDYSFGTLGETAKTRKAVLTHLLPRLKIAAQCELTDKFLVVKGSIRTYKIHLGSGNILMEPNDEYLCIVKLPGGKKEIYLPFEGDETLSVILSKAFLLAEDTKIKDTTITSQIMTG